MAASLRRKPGHVIVEFGPVSTMRRTAEGTAPDEGVAASGRSFAHAVANRSMAARVSSWP